MPFTRKPKLPYRAVKQHVIGDREIEMLVKRAMKKMKDELRAEVRAEVLETIRKEKEAAAFEQQIAEARDAELAHHFDMNMILGSRHEILSCIFYHFGTDILDGLPDEVGTSIFLMMDLKAEDGHTRGNICPNCIYPAMSYRNMFVLERAMEDTGDRDQITMGNLVRFIMTVSDDALQTTYLRQWEEEGNTGWSRYKQTQLNRLSPPA